MLKDKGLVWNDFFFIKSMRDIGNIILTYQNDKFPTLSLKICDFS